MTLDEKKMALIRALVVAMERARNAQGPNYVRQNELDKLIVEMERDGNSKRRIRTDGLTEADIRNQVIEYLNHADLAAGRPLLTSLIVGHEMRPPSDFYKVIKERDALKISPKDVEQKESIHRSELDRALTVDWRTVHSAAFL